MVISEVDAIVQASDRLLYLYMLGTLWVCIRTCKCYLVETQFLVTQAADTLDAPVFYLADLITLP